MLLILVFTFAFSNSLFSNSFKNNSEKGFKNGTTISSSSKTLEEKVVVSLNVFPNPATDKLFVRFNGWDGVKEIKLIDITGRSVFVLKSAEEIIEIDISSFPKGIYIINAINDFQRVTKKIKIQ